MTEIKFGKLKKGDSFVFKNHKYTKVAPIYKSCCTIEANAIRKSNR